MAGVKAGGVTLAVLPSGPPELSHLSFSRIFAETFSGDRRYWPERGRWMAWSDPMAFDGEGGWTEATTPLSDMGSVIESAVEGEDSSKWGRVNHIRGSLELAGETLAWSEWDSDPDLLGLSGGRA